MNTNVKSVPFLVFPRDGFGWVGLDWVGVLDWEIGLEGGGGNLNV